MKTTVSTTIAIVALVISIATLLLSRDWSPSDDIQTTTAEQIVELEREIAHLKGTVYEADLEANDTLPSTIDQVEAASTAASELDKLQQTVNAMRWTMTVRGVMHPTKEHLEKAHRQIFDDETPIKKKVVALRILRNCSKRSDEVVRKMIEVYYRTSDFNLQAEIFSQLDDMDTPELSQVLLEASSSSPDARVRKEAIDSLSGFLPDPDLFDWLKQVSTNDSEKVVRREAERLLKKYNPADTN